MKQITLVVLLLPWFAGCKKDSAPDDEPEDKPKKAIVTTIAGIGEMGYLDATAAFAKFYTPMDVAVHTDGTIYITERNNRVRKLHINGLVYTVAGNGNYGVANGPVAMASFKGPSQNVLDAAGNLYTLEESNYQVRKIVDGGEVSVFAGRDVHGFADGRADTARFIQGWGITMDAGGAIYVADTYNYRIRKIANGFVTTVAGTGTPGYLDGNALQAQFKKPHGIAVDKQGNLYVCDQESYRIRKISAAGTVSTLAGTGANGFVDGGPGTAQFNYLGDMVIDDKNNLYVLDGNAVRKISQAGEVTTIAGAQAPGSTNGEGPVARFSGTRGLGIDKAGNIYVADGNNHLIRKISFE